MKRYPLLLGSFTLFSVSTFASVGGDLTHYFDNLGFSSNVTAPTVYKGQEAGYYSGGSLFARDRVRNVQIANIELPQYRSGCGGIDLFTGGFSFVNSKQLVDAMKNIMNNAGGYAFNLALESATPEIANAMKYMNTLAGDVNRLNINSCETAAGLVGSAWPKTHVAQEQVCQDVGTGGGVFSDYAAARQGCGAGGQMSSTLTHAQGAYKNLVFKSGNIAWQAAQQNSFLASDSELAEFFMALSGTVILNNTSNSDSSTQQYKVLASLATDPSLLKAVLHGGSAPIYRCDDTSKDGCLSPVVSTVTITPEQALASQVRKLLDDMVNKIYSDSPLTSAEVGLLNATRLPVYKMLNVQSAFAGSASVIDVQSYADVIASDILFQYLNESLSVVQSSSAALQLPDAVMTQFSQGISAARTSIRAAEGSAYQQINMAEQLIQQTEGMERALAGSLSSQMNDSLSWANEIEHE